MGLPFKRSDAENEASYALYGKLPARADFVRINANHPAVIELDSVIQRALDRLSEQEGGLDAYDNAHAATFQLLSNDARYRLNGVLVPSRDQAGRRYPLLAASIDSSTPVLPDAALGPIVHEVFFDGLREQVRNAIDNSVEALSCREFLGSQAASNMPADDLELAASVVKRFTESTPVARLADWLNQRGEQIELNQALLNLAFYRAFLRRFDNAATKQLLAFPLPPTGGEQALEACTWLSVVQALADGRDFSNRWAGNYAIVQLADKKMVLLTSFGQMHDKFATPILSGMLDHASVLDLASEQEAWKKHRLYSEVSYALSRFLGDASLSVRELCEFLRDVGQKVKDTI